MYCVACGSLLPNEAQFCPRCGKRNGTEETTFGPTSSDSVRGDETEATSSLALSESSTRVDDTIPTARNEAGKARQSVSETLEPDSPTQAASAVPVTEGSKPPARYANVGSITLGVAALICLVLSAIQGFIPIFLIECVAFGGLPTASPLSRSNA